MIDICGELRNYSHQFLFLNSESFITYGEIVSLSFALIHPICYRDPLNNFTKIKLRQQTTNPDNYRDRIEFEQLLAHVIYSVMFS